jgi:hypothetical protein
MYIFTLDARWREGNFPRLATLIYRKMLLGGMKMRSHQFLDLFILGFLLVMVAQSLLLGNGVFDRMGILATMIVATSILFGVLIAAYVVVSKKQIFDPLDSELDEHERIALSLSSRRS